MVASTPPNPCLNCGADVAGPDGDPNPPQPQHCSSCPPWRCEDCGEMCSIQDTCSCWIDISTMPLADVKALFAGCDDDLTVDPA